MLDLFLLAILMGLNQHKPYSREKIGVFIFSIAKPKQLKIAYFYILYEKNPCWFAK